MKVKAFFSSRRVLWLHLAFWGAYGSLGWYQFQFQAGYSGRQVAASVLVPLAGYWLLAYFNYFVLLPRWLAHQRLGRYALEFAGPFGLVVAGRVLLLRELLGHDQGRFYYLNQPAYWVLVAASTFFLVLFVGLLRFALGWFELEARTKTLENARLAAELEFLKGQINPHFLFNTLNNLYYLAYTNSPHTPEVVARLAHMMRYLLDEAGRRWVPLSQEIAYLESYISLEKLRLNHPVPIGLTVAGGPTETVQIAPLMLITLLENAFKHGIHPHAPQAGWVEVRIALGPDTCTCIVENSRLPDQPDQPGRVAPASSASMVAPAGRGLPNLRRRLALSYPGRHTLAIDDLPDRFRVSLTLQARPL